ncbi:MAG: ATP-binding protein [Gemmatimonadota bacterium]|nr:ATP-binding protein [Gemmatimonadota bacterium]
MRADTGVRERGDRRIRSSVRAKLSLMYSGLLVAISTFIFLYFPATFERQVMQSMRAEAEAVGKMGAFSATSGVVFDDRLAIEEAVSGIMRIDDVLEVFVVDETGAHLASVQAEAAGEPRGFGAWTGSGVSPDGTVYRSVTPIEFGGRTLGDVRLTHDLLPVRARVAETRRAVGVVSSAVFLVGLFVILGIAKRVVGPLSSIVRTTERVAAGDMSQRATVKTTDEVGQLGVSFNRMIDSLDSARSELKEANDQLAQILEHLPAEVALFDLDNRYHYVNLLGIDEDSEHPWIIGKTPHEVWERRAVDSAVADQIVASMCRCVEDNEIVSLEQTVARPEGGERHYVRMFSPIAGPRGNVRKIVGYAVDVTQRREAEAALWDSQERLRQAQKMESIGQLAGGVAHDFNNLLTAISVNTELLLMDAEPGGAYHEGLNEIHRSSGRAAELTRSLLAFSRKQVLEPKVLDLNEVVSGIGKMLQRLIGENIKLQTEFAGSVPGVEADPGQLEQVIVNLAVNARDAMPDGGILTIRTGTHTAVEPLIDAKPELSAGRYVTLSVADTGSGMDEETAARAFEPFFTRKPVGEGTGLGLATVYGIVEQSGGAIHLYTEPGMGSVFRIYLPVQDEKIDLTDDNRAGSEDEMTGHQTVLITEDQESVRRAACNVLERVGYTVLSAEGPAQAIEIAAGHNGPIDLLLTDVVMPEMSGRDLADKFAAIRPGTPVLFMSGYSDDALLYHGVLDEGISLIEKPFSADALARAVQSRLRGEEVRPSMKDFTRVETAHTPPSPGTSSESSTSSA